MGRTPRDRKAAGDRGRAHQTERDPEGPRAKTWPTLGQRDTASTAWDRESQTDREHRRMGRSAKESSSPPAVQPRKGQHQASGCQRRSGQLAQMPLQVSVRGRERGG